MMVQPSATEPPQYGYVNYSPSPYVVVPFGVPIQQQLPQQQPVYQLQQQQNYQQVFPQQNYQQVLPQQQNYQQVPQQQPYTMYQTQPGTYGVQQVVPYDNENMSHSPTMYEGIGHPAVMYTQPIQQKDCYEHQQPAIYPNNGHETLGVSVPQQGNPYSHN